MDLREASCNGKIKQTKSKNYFENLKSNIMLKKILAYIKRNSSLEIMKYNKKLQKRLNLSFNDYKDYSQLYTPMELELKLVNYKNNDNKFINISDDNMKCYHIYFDNSNIEVKRTELKWKDKVKVIKIIIYHQITDKLNHLMIYLIIVIVLE